MECMGAHQCLCLVLECEVVEAYGTLAAFSVLSHIFIVDYNDGHLLYLVASEALGPVQQALVNRVIDTL